MMLDSQTLSNNKMRTLLLFSIFVISIVASSCKKGCTDPKALNYNEKVSVDNATCVYCNEKEENSETSLFLTDFNSPISNKEPLKLLLSQKVRKISGNGCNTIGKSPIENCFISLKVVNVTGFRITGNFSIVFNTGDGTSWSQSVGVNQILPLDTFNIGLVANSCTPFDEGVLSAEVFNFSLFYE